MIDLPRSTYYYCPKSSEAAIDDSALVKLIRNIHDEFPDYGYRRVTLVLRAAGQIINHMRIALVMKEHHLHARRRRRFKPASGNEADLVVFPNRYPDLHKSMND